MLRPHARRLRLRSKAATAVASALLMVAGLVVATPAQAVPGEAAATAVVTAAAGRSLETERATSSVASGIVKTADLTKFQPGNIVSDAVFYNSATMTEAQIQSFLNSKVTTCRSGHVCLKSKTDTTRAVAADAMCNAYAGGGVESAARILFKVAQACGINPQALIVMLQKEQGLVTDTWPVDSQYKIAMGQGCPDTAACDSRYFGFFNQVYGAAWQLKRYANPPGTSNYFTWYAPGKTWNVRWHPNASCGSSPVYIANQATAALYYYTPYQPNAAALRAGYGEGDGCSSYGNRNFYQYFTDWFGSTQGTANALVKVGIDVWLVTGERRYYVPAGVYSEYIQAFGTAVSTSQSYLQRFADSGRASLFVRNTSTGDIAYLQGGKTHRFGNCTLVQRWGGECSKRVELAPEHYARFGAGPAVTDYSRDAAGRYYRWWSGALRPVLDAESARLINGGSAPFAAVMPREAQAALPAGPMLFAPARALRVDGESRVYLPTSDGRLIYVPSFAGLADYGIPGSTFRVVQRSQVAGYTVAGSVAPIAICGTERFIAGSKKLTRLPDGAATGLASTPLDAATCAALVREGAPQSGQIFLGVTGAPEIYHLTGDTLRHVVSAELLQELNGGRYPATIRMSAGSLGVFTQSLPYLRPGTMVRADGTSAVFLVNGTSLLRLPDWEVSRALGLPTASIVISAAHLATAGSAQGTLGPFIRCGDSLFVAGNSGRSLMTTADSGGNPTVALAPSTCAQIPSRGTVTGPAFVTDGSRLAVAAAGGFIRLENASQAQEANGGTAPDPRRITAAYFDALPQGSGLPTAGAVVRSTGQPTVYFIDGARRLALPNWGVGDDLGISGRLSIRAAAESVLYPVRGSVSPLVGCGSSVYVGAQGQLRALRPGAEGGLRVQALDAATCASLRFSSAAPVSELRLTDGSGAVYVAQGGALVSVDPATIPPESVLTVSPGSLGVLRG
ncbi:hypothetical protein NQ166_04305 [Microbacterium sp. zg.Y1090]|uniref:hypothetical protein n=1 Tax=Microbacterium wangruii TaxID=3049073 RepID=UPI00214BC0B0|nr:MULTISPECIES: hypothetical protein [unclassified Microbacterium]MCR2818053.1 hypothetical protein [Microbacterium sp. zg.Y1090]WIM27789.1 hypothetical protein QNO26_11610 [Microbacterium sp. zg-Y1090]